MADVRPFRALRYKQDAIPNLDRVIVPPYDVISPAEQVTYHERDPHNIIRLELGETRPDDSAVDNRYTRAAATLDTWQHDGVLAEDDNPAYYAYEQEYLHQGARMRRRGFFAAVRLQPWSDGAVLPHEKTLAQPKADRLALLRATRANLSPIFSLYSDPSGVVAMSLASVWAEAPAVTCTDQAGESHRLWVVDDEDRCAAITRALAPVPLYIADGHHRYETALAFRDEEALPPQRGASTEREARSSEGEGAEVRAARGAGSFAPVKTGGSDAEAVLMVLVAADDAGLLVLPTHRLIHHVPAERVGGLRDALAPFFALEDLPHNASPDMLMARLAVEALPPQRGASTEREARSSEGEGAEAGQDAHALILVGPGPAACLLRLRVDALSGEAPGALRDLDVWLAHSIVLERGLGLDAAGVAREQHLSYTRDAAEAVGAVREGQAQLALLLNATPARSIISVADAGATMPQKSTYFYPKLITGLVMRLLH